MAAQEFLILNRLNIINTNACCITSVYQYTTCAVLHKRKKISFPVMRSLSEVSSGVEPLYTVLQTAA